jgi:molybdenum cofactor guanylyltransferase
VADRLAATGILLVGGASERFGSPKALATLRGETLAARGWRALSGVCDEVVAVGKTADGIELPFPVLDDGTDERAPVFGVIAGLRSAGHETCVVLPVDCPLVTPETLRELVLAVAVPQTGPLPGGYTKTMLAVLEGRVAGGERSLRGVNERCVELDERLLANVNTREDLVAAEATAMELADEREAGVLTATTVVGASELTALATDFWASALWSARLLRRGEVFRALECADGHLKALLVTLMAWHADATDSALETWPDGRLIERWADPGALSALEDAYAHYDVRDVARALWATIGLYQGLEEETARRLGVELELDGGELRRRVAEIVPDPRRRP